MTATVAADGSLRIEFSKLTSGGTQTIAPEPGQCGWYDRGISNDEPNQILFSGSKKGVFYLIDGLLSAGEFRLLVNNNNQGSLVVAKIER